MNEVLCNLSDTAIAEYDASAKCLAFRLPTAAGFHMMRAIEFVLVPYVQIFSGRNFSSLNTNWGSYVAHLKSVLKGAARRKPKVQNVDLIRQLKNNYRNPVMHADMVLTEEEARYFCFGRGRDKRLRWRKRFTQNAGLACFLFCVIRSYT
jgi:hypothetical protein